MRHAADILKWSDEVLESQRPAVEKGVFPGEYRTQPASCRTTDVADYGSSTVTQIAHVASSLLAVIRLLQPDSSSDAPVSLLTCIGTFHSAIHLLRSLRARFDVVIRHLDPLEHYAAQLGVSLPTSEQLAVPTYQFGQGTADATTMGLPGLDTKTGEELVSEALGVLASETAMSETQQPGQSGSGAIQALLSLSGRTGEEGAGGDTAAGSEGLEAWWANLLSGSSSGETLDERFLI